MKSPEFIILHTFVNDEHYWSAFVCHAINYDYYEITIIICVIIMNYINTVIIVFSQLIFLQI